MNNSQAGSSTSISTAQIPKQPKRTTKETHPNLPPGLILDENGKVCKICNSWQDWGRIKVKKRDSSGNSSEGPNTGSTAKASSSSAGMGAMGSFASMMSGTSRSGSKSSTPTTIPDPLIATSTASNPTRPLTVNDRSECPPDTIALGRSTWTFLHTTAAYYPLKAPPKTQENMRSLLSSLSLLYPCQPCAEDFQVKVKENPPDLSGRHGLSRWLCERHNEVNEKLGKESFNCDWNNLNRRWKDGPDDGSCD